jgi:hypothetical protein
MDNMTRCILAGPHRSGTTYMHTLLMGHPEISGIQEEVKVDPLFIDGISTFTFGNEHKEEKSKGYLALLNALSNLNKNERTRCSFIKVAFLHPLYLKKFIETYNAHLTGVKLIITLRENLLAQYASHLRKNKTKIVTLTKQNTSDNPNVKVKINKRKFKKYLYKMIYLKKLLMHHFEERALFVSYEKDIQNQNPELNKRVFDYLSLEKNIAVTWQNQKKVSPSPENYIKDYNRTYNFYRFWKNKYEDIPLENFKLSFEENKLFRIKKEIKKIIKIIKE